MSTQDAVREIEALTPVAGSLCEVAHIEADNIILRSVAPEIREAYDRLVAGARWWAAA